MANRCPDCNKFVSLETQDPESNGVEINARGLDTDTPTFTITGEVRLVRACAECGTEMRSYDFSVEEDITDKVMAWMKDNGKSFSVDHNPKLDANGEPLATEDAESPHDGDPEAEEEDVELTEERVKGKDHFGFHLNYVVKCACGETLYEGEMADSVVASDMEECC